MDAFLAPFLKSARRKRTARTGRAHEGDPAAPPGRVVLSIFDVPPGLLMRAEGSGSRNDGVQLSDAEISVEGSGIVLPNTYNSSSSSSTSSSSTSTAAASGGGSEGKKTARALTCIRCGLSFGDDRPAQVLHFKSDLHMANLRRQLAGKPPISQEQLDDEVASTAAVGPEGAGDDEEERDSSSGTDTDEALVGAADRGLTLEDVAEEDEGVGDGLHATVEESGGERRDSTRGRVKLDFSLQEGPRLTFVPRGSAWAFSLSSAALGMQRGDDPWERLDGLVGDEGGGANRLWAVVILRSGKFAAAVFEGQSVLCHKVFRRYTIRAKRGGSQSSYDSGGRKAQSAGAALRRYGEQALREDARALLKEWEGPLKACRVVLTSVPKGMRAVLFDGRDAPFERKDPRLRPVPFAVGKPVFEEVVAVHTRVTSIVFSDAAGVPFDVPKPATTKEGSAAKKGSSGKASVVAGGAAAAEATVAQQADVEPCPPSIELVEACERGDADAVTALLDRLELAGGYAAPPGPGGAVAVDVPGDGGTAAAAAAGAATATTWTTQEVMDRPDGLERLMTPLHVSAAGGHVAALGVLLERGANPLAEDVRGRVPYLLASNKDTRDAFRRARARLPERWDWAAARVPEPLTEELEQRQKEKLKEKEKEKKRRAKLRKKAEKDRAAEEARQKKEREDAEAEDRRKRGLAAAGHCDACGKVLVAKKAFSRFEFRYCSSDCANLHKRKLAADAAERRFNST